LNKEAIKVVVNHKQDIINLNQEQLLGTGTDKFGKQLKRYRSKSYAIRKNKRNPLPGLGVPDLYDTGASFEGMKIDIVDENKYSITSTDSKTKDLEKKYGKDILGLSVESKTEMIKEFFQNDLVKNIKQSLKL